MVFPGRQEPATSVVPMLLALGDWDIACLQHQTYLPVYMVLNGLAVSQ